MLAWFTHIVSSSAFLNGFWVFIGVVAGAIIQHILNRLSVRWQAKNAHRILLSEIGLNLSELERFRDRVLVLKNLISAGQAGQSDIFVNMQGFDYSVVNPLVGSGYFHLMLGPEFAGRYFQFMRFFNNQNAQALTLMLEREHQSGTSLKFLRWLEARVDELEAGLQSIRAAKLRGGRLMLNRM